MLVFTFLLYGRLNHRIRNFNIIILGRNLQRLCYPIPRCLRQIRIQTWTRVPSKYRYSQQQKATTTKIIWFNPPYSKSVKTNIGKIFLNLIKKHFPPHHKFHKLFDKNTVKISYSCTQNIKTITNPYNTKILFHKKVLNKEYAIA